MLYEFSDRTGLLARFGSDVVRGFTIRNFCRPAFGDNPPARLFVDNLEEPRVLIAMIGAMVHVEGEIDALNPAFADLLAGRVEAVGGWPTAEIQSDWVQWNQPSKAVDDEPSTEESAGGDDAVENCGNRPLNVPPQKRHLFFNASSLASWRAACIAGFAPNEHDRDGFVAYQWHWLGPPRFAHLVKHPCRVVEGLELFELVKRGASYDPEGYYMRQCLLRGPSFVCEVDGEPVCWSCTHLTRFMAVIYTPEEHRRHGYARSLAALQIDTMLERDGIACCHVIDSNTPSMSLVHSLGGQVTSEPIVWRSVYWPE